ncbi:MAG TPA: hypothetical protein VF660_06895 [Actinomycetota bacterium]
MRRTTLFMIIALFLLITIGAIAQVATRTSRRPIPNVTLIPTVSPSG